MIEELEKMLKSAATEVFRTMLNFQLDFEAMQSPSLDGHPHVARAVGFTGNFNGVVYLYCTGTFARQITGTLLGLSVDHTGGDEMVNDAMGELTNMLAGHIKSRLCDRGRPCSITIPTVVRGRDFRIEPVNGAEKRAIWVVCSKNRVLLEILMKQ